MREDYKAAKKLGDDAVKEANKKGISPYLPILDENPAVKEAVSACERAVEAIGITIEKG